MNKKTLLAIVALATATLAGAQTSDQDKIVLTTTKAVGEKIRLSISKDSDAGDDNEVWIDLNNNGIKEPGEEVTNNEDYYASDDGVHSENYNDPAKRNDPYISTEYTLGAQTITIYGKIWEFGCRNTQLTGLNVSSSSEINVNCQDNQLTALDVSKAPMMYQLYCSNNQLTALDVSKASILSDLYCGDNQLTALDVSANKELMTLHCQNNQMDACALNALFESLRDKNSPARATRQATTHAKTRAIHIDPFVIDGNPGVPTSNTDIAREKDWNPDIDGDGTAVCPENNGIGEEEAVAFAIYPNPAHATLHVNLPDGMQAHTLTLHDMTGKTVLSQTISGTSATIDVRAFARGIYLVKIGHSVHKLVIK